MVKQCVFSLLILFLIGPLIVRAQDTLPASPENRRKVECPTEIDAFIRHIEQGALAYAKSDYRTAYEHYQCAVQLDPTSWIAYRGRGMSLVGLGSYQLAIADFDVALDMKPDDPELHFQRGVALYRLEAYDAALRSLSQAIVLNPSDARLFVWRGLAHQAAGHLDEAIRDFQIAITQGIPDNPYIPYLSLGDLYLEDKHNPVEALYWYQEAARVSPASGFIYKKIGDTYLLVNNLGAAEQNYERYIQLTNTADESVRRLVEAGWLRQFVLRYVPSVLIGLILVYFVVRALYTQGRLHRTRATGQTVPGAEIPDSATPRPGGLLRLLLPLLDGLAVILRRGTASPEDRAG